MGSLFTTWKSPISLRIDIRGTVQGTGFRPFVYRLAREMQIRGTVKNTASGVRVFAAGERAHQFAERLRQEAPGLVREFQCVGLSDFDDSGDDSEFSILESDGGSAEGIAPDVAVCEACRRELEDPSNRRYQYPFITCTACGPRYSLWESGPFDRETTSMSRFPPCRACAKEYVSPESRRFHAQTISCGDCGPRLTLMDSQGTVISPSLPIAVEWLKAGKVLAVKGLTGFHLMVDATNDAAIQTLRERKHRPHKPFAVMAESLLQARNFARISDEEAVWLYDFRAPVVLLSGLGKLPPAVSGNLNRVGLMLAYSPLHLQLLKQVGVPLVATSANLSGGVIAGSEEEVFAGLAGVVDGVLTHDRHILRPLDDSVGQVIAGEFQLIRRARGWVPQPIAVAGSVEAPVMGVGGHIKSTVARFEGNRIRVSEYLGDLDEEKTLSRFEKTAEEYVQGVAGGVCDSHPDYGSSRWANLHIPVLSSIGHHEAHIWSVLAEGVALPCLGFAWDGFGLGNKGEYWGGEGFHVDAHYRFRRFFSLRSFPLAGGNRAMREPRYSALGLLFEMLGSHAWERAEEWFSPEEIDVLRVVLPGSPRCTSVGRLFDGVALLLGGPARCSYEGQSAMELEARATRTDQGYRIPVHSRSGILLADWEPMLRSLETEGDPGRFHRSLAELLAFVSLQAMKTDSRRICLSGGVFQNKLLLESAVDILKQQGCEVFWNKLVPPNDGGLSLGQAYSAMRKVCV